MIATSLFLALDLVGALLVLVIVGFFLAVFRTSRNPLHLLFAIGFTFLALGMSLVSTSEFDLARPVDRFDSLRITAHTAAALVLAFSYVSARRGDVRVWRVLAGAVAATAALFAALLVVPPFLVFPDVQLTLTVAHSIQFIAYAICVVLSSASFVREPSGVRALVPTAFLAYAFSKYTWILIDVSDADALVPVVYAWRFAMLGLMLTALALPYVRRREVARPDAAT